MTATSCVEEAPTAAATRGDSDTDTDADSDSDAAGLIPIRNRTDCRSAGGVEYCDVTNYPTASYDNDFDHDGYISDDGKHLDEVANPSWSRLQRRQCLLGVPPLSHDQPGRALGAGDWRQRLRQVDDNRWSRRATPTATATRS